MKSSRHLAFLNCASSLSMTETDTRSGVAETWIVDECVDRKTCLCHLDEIDETTACIRSLGLERMTRRVLVAETHLVAMLYVEDPVRHEKSRARENQTMMQPDVRDLPFVA